MLWRNSKEKPISISRGTNFLPKKNPEILTRWWEVANPYKFWYWLNFGMGFHDLHKFISFKMIDYLPRNLSKFIKEIFKIVNVEHSLSNSKQHPGCGGPSLRQPILSPTHLFNYLLSSISKLIHSCTNATASVFN